MSAPGYTELSLNDVQVVLLALDCFIGENDGVEDAQAAVDYATDLRAWMVETNHLKQTLVGYVPT